ncbi:unnamed protein product [Zymoseptoria tritici ST99CH_1A5]|uniref:Allantoin permease n=1 Tax=Zymoseptoria tritici ST99CH_1A5 TaxID=1276529 RepID=A0A1Y6M125_ZYMTR|nr:unnamed protein product [Zymoseptoria tritici ST99CH_1A5]
MGLPSKTTLAAPFQSKHAFRTFLKAPEAPPGTLTVGKGRWSNRDLEPTPPSERTWQWYSLPLFWLTNAFGPTGWNAAASLIATGMTWQQTFIASVLGCFISALMVMAMARPGVQYHLGFPVLCRSVMGMWGAFFFIFIRGVVCIIWFGVQTFYAANLLSVAFRCMFGASWSSFPNTLSPSSGLTSAQLLCFFLVWMIQLPLVFVHPKKIHYLYTIKGILLPISTFALFGWCMSTGSGTKALSLANDAGAKARSAVPLGWAIMNGINIILGTLSPMLVNQPDLSRYCNRTRDAGWIHGLSLFGAKVLVLFLGLASTASIQGVWGVAYWNIWDLLDAILDHYWTAGARTGVWCVAMTYVVAAIATNLGANSLPFGADLTSFAPKYVTIVRGQIICAVLGVVVQPWLLLQNASKFLTFLSSYNIYMAPICSVWIVDYLFVRRGNLHTPSMYDGSKGSLYWFWSGVNWVGVFAWFCGMVTGLPGLVGQLQPGTVGPAAVNMYKMGWLLSFVTAGTVYYVLRLFVKAKIHSERYESMPRKWEYMAKEGREGFYDGEWEAPTVIEGTDVSSGSSDIETAMISVNKNEK